MNDKAPIPILRRIVFAVVAVLLVWLSIEFFLLIASLLLPRSRADFLFLYGPHPYRAYAPVPGRADRFRQFSFNSLGLRGPEIAVEKPPDLIRIVCLGGSTTFSDGATTNSTAFPARMERLLREHYRDAPFRIEVLNAGVQAYNSLESLVHFQTSLLDLAPDIAVFHHGLNDCWFMIEMFNFRSDYTHARQTFAIHPPKWWEYSPFLSLLIAHQSGANPYFPAHFVNLNVPILVQPGIVLDPRKGRHGELEPQMIAAFERNMRSSIAIARANEIFPVLSTQSAYDDSAQGGLWIRSMGRLNQVTRDIALSESVGLVDFARLMPWNPVDYYDQVHLRDTPTGLGRQAEIFAHGLINMRAVEQVWGKRKTHKDEGGRTKDEERRTGGDVRTTDQG